MGNWFWFMILLGIVLALWESIGVIEVSIIVADIMVALFPGALPVVVYQMLFVVNIFVFAKALFFRPITPQ